MPASRGLRALTATTLTVVLCGALGGCMGRVMTRTPDAPGQSASISQLWVEPPNIRARNLRHGPGGAGLAPQRSTRFTAVAFDRGGFSPGYDATDANGRSWKIKLGPEVQPEIVASRLLWAIGYHQPPLYFVDILHLDGGQIDHRGVPARLRFEEEHSKEDEWSWHENPFVGTRPLNGLLVANLIVNNWDLKPSQNRIYVMKNGGRPARRFVVQDLGASLGKTGWPTGTKNDIEGFESQNLIAGVEDGRVRFDYHARHQELFADITPADVAWTARLLSRLSDEQWHDAFRAAGYPEPLRTRFIAKLRSKVQEGLALSDPPQQRATVGPSGRRYLSGE